MEAFLAVHAPWSGSETLRLTLTSRPQCINLFIRETLLFSWEGSSGTVHRHLPNLTFPMWRVCRVTAGDDTWENPWESTIRPHSVRRLSQSADRHQLCCGLTVSWIPATETFQAMFPNRYQSLSSKC
ncbi:hypothetical protein H920_15535 [Fukomys damarensis]|uniref:Uncharacterized protein n=1 Tax=Fukomys damarensis TaxID=885580 RepID=A0A091CU91_FUKDA|nr:hypothetical protein H920_15535 [Fukomys damarensis]